MPLTETSLVVVACRVVCEPGLIYHRIMAQRRGRRRPGKIDLGVATVVGSVLALVGVIAVALLSSGNSANSTTPKAGSPARQQSASGPSAQCANGSKISGSGNTISCAVTVQPGPSKPAQPTIGLGGLNIPVTCHPEGESAQLQASLSLEVHVWCSELALRRLVQAKLKVWADNQTGKTVNVSLDRWFLLVPGTQAVRTWSAPPGRRWPQPFVLRLPRGSVTAIPANPDNAAEVLSTTAGDVNDTFATHWQKQTLAPGEVWHPRLRNRDRSRYLDGTLVFYVPLIRRNGNLYEPQIIGLARIEHDTILTLCPISRWGPRVSAESF
jgi:hypothetical protein